MGKFRKWKKCPWLQSRDKCRLPLHDENWPNGCDPDCPARLKDLYQAEQRERENTERMFH